ncbi:YebC-like protein [Stereum hirsutum FP-91666 SS1]|uniref:YebC-like protein n=1 Tax=Stereum hirsutum (strain FP-91666) TaxID=721885 RepID=UPI000440E2F4|nr:YebC-like protein [Stereum hirsutum FP-91666 SS1]EIM90450.1 YebC-like protein [Stereum hirsutum FP-91666 SS1]
MSLASLETTKRMMMSSRSLSRTCQLSRALHTYTPRLAGHSKWSKIKDQKGANDRQKSKIYGGAFRDIMVAVRNGGSANPETNLALFNALRKARDNGVPKQNIENALAKASGEKDKSTHTTYEVMAHGSVGVVVECITDNTNRTLQRLREILNKNNSRLATVGFLFQRKGCVRVSVEKGENFEARMEKLIETALEADAEDFEESTDMTTSEAVEIQFLCPPQELAKLTTAVTASGLSKELITSELIYTPSEGPVETDEEMETNIGKLIEELEEYEDTLRVWTTLDSNEAGS